MTTANKYYLRTDKIDLNNLKGLQEEFANHVITKDEFEKAYKLLLEKSNQPAEFENHIRTGEDNTGHFIELPIE